MNSFSICVEMSGNVSPFIISSFCAESLPTADVEYVEVKPQKKRKERKEKKEEEVQYGEVMFTLNRSNAHLQPQHECIYSQVHTV